MDDGLLARARAAAAAMAEAERTSLLARTEYHTAIRRLHNGGATHREIAAALSISHQRVKQIVDEAGGSWWQRVWRFRKPAGDAVCSFCGRPPSEVKKLVAGPGIYLCDGCVAAAEAGASREGTCSFCGKTAPVFGVDARVCGSCARLAHEIMDGRLLS